MRSGGRKRQGCCFRPESGPTQRRNRSDCLSPCSDVGQRQASNRQVMLLMMRMSLVEPPSSRCPPPLVPLSVTVQNNGAALGIGNSNSYCSTTVTINQVPLPPVLSNTVFFVPELSPVGTYVGNVGAVDPANFSVGNFVWASVDSVRRQMSTRQGDRAHSSCRVPLLSPQPNAFAMPSRSTPPRATSPSHPWSTRSRFSRTRGRCVGSGG